MNRLKFLALIIAVCLTISATNSIFAQNQYSFVQYSANRLHYDSTSAPMQFLFQKWQRVTSTGQGNLNIIHIGGSHVQAGTLPNRIRTNIYNDYPKSIGCRGLLFPYSAAAKCNNPSDYKVHCKEKMILTRNVYRQPEHPLGLCGIAVTAANTPSRIQIILNEPKYNYNTTRLTVLGRSPQGVVPRLNCGGAEMHPSYIDTANHRFHFNLQSSVDSFEVVLPCHENQEFTLQGIYLSNRQSGITYSSIGVNGAAVPDYFKCSLINDLRLLRPDLVIFGIGINDAHGKDFDSVAFKRNYLRLCDSIKAVSPNCAFIFITNNDCYRKTGRRSYSVNTNGLLVREVCYRLAAITGGAVWDQFEIMGGLKSMAQWQNAGLAQADKVHFTRSGYQLIGDLFYQALDRELQKDWKPAKVVNHKPSRQEPSTKHLETKDSKERPLPRGLRRKPKPQESRTPLRNQTSTTTKKIDSDRFPYLPE